MEQHTFREPGVARLLEEHFAEARLHMDGRGKKYEGLQTDMVRSKATPIYVIIDPKTGQKLSVQEGPSLRAQDFEEFLRQVVRKYFVE